MSERYSMDKYTMKLCDAVEAYDFPAVTYDFKHGIEINHCESDPTHEVKKHRECMREVEETIGSQLRCEDMDVVKVGLSNVLYWGCAGPKLQHLRWTWISKFQDGVKDYQLDRFKRVVHRLRGPGHPGLVAIRGRRNNKTDNMPRFTMIPFVSKIRMFLDPSNYPVLDTQIAEFANSPSSPLYGLKMQSGITEGNDEVYENWASRCRQIARRINAYDDSPCEDLLAVDVERGIFHLAGLDCEDDRIKACRLLLGPEPENQELITEN